MGLGRRHFLRLFGATIAAVASNPLEAIVVDGDLYINRALGLAFRKPVGWHFLALKEFKPLRDAQILKDDALSEELRGTEDPIAVMTQTPYKKGRISSAITVYAEEFQLEQGETLKNMLPGIEHVHQRVLSNYRHLGNSTELLVSDCDSIEYFSEFLYEDPDVAIMARNRSVVSVREPQLFTINMFDYPSKGHDAQGEYDNFTKSIAFV